jgi:F0F1-type ATP synthase assembly protein I
MSGWRHRPFAQVRETVDQHDRGHTRGVDLPDLLFAVVGVGALLASLLPRVLEGRPFSLPIVFVALGLLLGALPFLPVDASQPGTRAS